MGRRRKSGTPANKPGPPCPALLTWLSSRITREELEQIAALDYMTDVPQHLSALRRIAAGDLSVLSPLAWHPQEVLNLARWDEGGEWDESRHRKRLFATTSLLVAAAESVNADRTLSINESAITAVESVIRVYPDRADDLVEVIDTLAERWERSDELPHLKLAKLLLREARGAPPDELSALVEDADRMATSAREDPYCLWKRPKGAYGWVLDLTAFDQRARLWRRLLDEALERLMAKVETEGVAEKLATLRERKA